MPVGSVIDEIAWGRARRMLASVLAVGDGAPGFWGWLREGLPDTGEQRRWFHKWANVRVALIESVYLAAKITEDLPPATAA